MTYTIITPKAVQKQLDTLPNEVYERVATKVQQLVENPRPDGVVKLKGSDNEAGRLDLRYRQESINLNEVVDMTHPKFSGEEIARRGKELYEKGIRAQVETAENIGKIISINVETGDYEIGDDLVVTSRRLQAKHADAAIWTERIGFNAVYAVGGTLVRTA